jgi:predicted O-methyltransferase YrrM
MMANVNTAPLHSLMKTVQVARRRARFLGRKAAVETVLTEAVPGWTRRGERLVGRPTLLELQQHGSWSTSARELLKNSIGLDDPDWDRVEAEFAGVERSLASRHERVQVVYPGSFAVERETSLLLYGLARLLQPECVVETGVADGASSFVLLAALQKNGKGELHSLDISNDVGALVDNRDSWHLHVVDVRIVEDEFADMLSRVPPPALFLHDADHRYLAQLCEYATFAATAPPGAIVLSDDVDYSYAFGEFCENRGLRPNYLFDSRKVAGLVRL